MSVAITLASVLSSLDCVRFLCSSRLGWTVALVLPLADAYV